MFFSILCRRHSGNLVKTARKADQRLKTGLFADFFYGLMSICQQRRGNMNFFVSNQFLEDGVLYGCTTLKLRESLDEKEWSELKEYMEGQYSDGWGEHTGRREIPIDGGSLYLQFWQYYGFHFFHKEEICVGETLEELCTKYCARSFYELIPFVHI